MVGRWKGLYVSFIEITTRGKKGATSITSNQHTTRNQQQSTSRTPDSQQLAIVYSQHPSMTTNTESYKKIRQNRHQTIDKPTTNSSKKRTKTPDPKKIQDQVGNKNQVFLLPAVFPATLNRLQIDNNKTTTPFLIDKIDNRWPTRRHR